MVEIGFEQELYSVDEDAGTVSLGVAIFSGSLSSNVVVRVQTAQSTAMGKSTSK